MKKLLVCCLAACLMVATLVGCDAGGAASGAPGSESTANTSGLDGASTEGSDDGEKITLRIASYSQVEDPEGPTERAIADKWLAKNPNISIEWIGVPANDGGKKLTAWASANDLPDMTMISSDWYVPIYNLDIMHDLREVLPEDFLADFYESILDEASVDGHLMVLPYQSMAVGVLARKDWLEETGLGVPETWDEFREVAKAMTKDTDGDGQPDRWGFAMMATRDSSAETRFNYIVQSYGQRIIARDEQGEWYSDVGTPEFRQAMEMFCNFSLVDGITPPGVLETSYSEAANLIVAEKAGMILTGSNAVGTILKQNPDLDGKLMSFVVPMQTEHTSASRALGFGICKTTEHLDECVSYLMHICEDENLLEWNAATGRVATKASVADAPQFQTEVMKGFVEGLDYVWPAQPYDGVAEIQDACAEAYQAILAGQSTVDEACDVAQERVAEILESYR